MTKHYIPPAPSGDDDGPDVQYYTELQSYTDKVEEAKHFTVCVATVKGATAGITSTKMPIKVLPALIAAVEIADRERSAFSIWDHQMGTIVMIPHDQIASVTFYLY